MFLNPCSDSTPRSSWTGTARSCTPYEQYVKWGGITLAVQLVFTIILILFCMRKKNGPFLGSQKAGTQPGFAPAPLLTPFIPVFLLIVFKVPIIMGFLIGGFYALFVCGS